MHRQRFLLAALLAALIVSIGVMGPGLGAMAQGAAAAAARGGQGGKPAPTSFPVTSTVNDIDNFGNPLQLQSDDLNVNLTPTSQPWGIYHTNGSASSPDVVNQIDGTNLSAWTLNLSRSSSRSVNLTFSRLSGSGFTDTKSLHAVVISKCFDPNGGTTGDMNWFFITTFNPNCSLRVNFTIGKTDYALVMSPLHDTPLPTGRAVVTCTRLAGDGSCSAWTVLPNLTQDSAINPNPTVANLYSVGRTGALTFIGQYILTYSANVTYP